MEYSNFWCPWLIFIHLKSWFSAYKYYGATGKYYSHSGDIAFFTSTSTLSSLLLLPNPVLPSFANGFNPVFFSNEDIGCFLGRHGSYVISCCCEASSGFGPKSRYVLTPLHPQLFSIKLYFFYFNHKILIWFRFWFRFRFRFAGRKLLAYYSTPNAYPGTPSGGGGSPCC